MPATVLYRRKAMAAVSWVGQVM